MKTIAIKCLIILFACAWLPACNNNLDITPSGKTFNIAFVGSGQAGKSGRDQDVLEGILAANAADAMLDNGDRLEIVHVPELVAQNAVGKSIAETISGYVERDHISAVLLGVSSKTLLEEKHRIDELGVPTLAVIATHPDVTDKAEYISQISFDDQRQAQSAAMYVRDELALKRAAVLFDDVNPNSGYLGQVFRTTFEKVGGSIETFSVFSQLNQSLLTELKDKGTQILYVPLSAQHVFHVQEQLEILDWDPVVMSADGLLATVQQVYPERLSELDGMYVTDLYSDADEFLKLAKFVKRITGFYEKMFSDKASTDTTLGVESYQLIKYAINLCPDRHNATCINQKIRSAKIHQGVMSKFSIRANGKASRPVFVNLIEDGRLNLIVKVH